MKAKRGHWHGDQYYFGLHYDLHAGPGDTDLGARCGLKELVPMLKLLPDPAIRVRAPICVDVALRRRGGTVMVHLVNRASGIPNLPNNGAIDDIPPVGPVTVRMRLARRPASVKLALEKGRPTTRVENVRGGVRLEIVVPSVHIHAAVIIKNNTPGVHQPTLERRAGPPC